jgi:hypothetical protein
VDRLLLAYVSIALMVALAASIAVHELVSSRKRNEHRRRRLENAEYERVMAKRGQAASKGTD